MLQQQVAPNGPSETPSSPDVNAEHQDPQGPEGVQPQSGVPSQEANESYSQDDLTARIEAEKEIYRQKKLIKKREEELLRREQELSKPKSVDDLLDDILNTKNEENEDHEDDDQVWTQEDIIRRAKEEIYSELQQEQESYNQEQYAAEVSQNFTHEIGDYIHNNVDQFPLASELGLHEQISQEMQSHLEQLEEEYGEEYAQKWFESLDWNKHIAHYENTLAENFRTMLKSERVRNLLKSYLGEENQMPTGEPPRTLSRGNFNSSSGTAKSLEEMTVDERVAYAKAQLRKQHQGQ